MAKDILFKRTYEKEKMIDTNLKNSYLEKYIGISLKFKRHSIYKYI